MNEIIERYIYDVTRRLPEEERAEVSRELEISITDMLPDNADDDDINDVLTKLGAPRILAEQYRQNPRYLISPAMYEMYISVLKKVTVIVAGVCAGIGACVGALVPGASGSPGDIIESIVGTAIDGVLQAVIWITVGFVIYDRFGIKHKPWSVDDLPKVPDRKGVKISRSSTIAGMIFTVLFLSALILMIVRENWLFVLASGSEIINPFSQAALDRSIPFLFLLGGLALVVQFLKLYWAKWNIPLCAANILYNVTWVSIVIHIMRWPDLISEEYTVFASGLTGDIATLNQIWGEWAIVFFTVVFVMAAAIDIGESLFKTLRGVRD